MDKGKAIRNSNIIIAVVVFSVASLSLYSAIYVGPSITGRAIENPSLITLSKDILKEKVAPGSNLSREIIVKSNAPVIVSLLGIEEIVSLESETIESKEGKARITISPGEDIDGPAIGLMIFTSGDYIKELPVIIDISPKEKELIVDVIPEKIGQTADFQITLFDETSDQSQTIISYSIRDLKGNIVAYKEEQVDAKPVQSFFKGLSLPESVEKGGDYILSIKARKGGLIATSSSIIRVVPKEKGMFNMALILSIAAIIVVAYALFHRKRDKNIKEEIALFNMKLKEAEKSIKKKDTTKSISAHKELKEMHERLKKKLGKKGSSIIEGKVKAISKNITKKQRIYKKKRNLKKNGRKQRRKDRIS